MALQQRSIITEQKMVRPADHDPQLSVRRQTIVNRSHVGQDVTALRVRLPTMVAQQEQEWPMDACLNDAAVRSAVHIDPCLAPGILMAKLCCGRSSKGVTKDSHSGHVQPSRELAGRVRTIQSLQPIKDERDVGNPRSQQSVHAMNLLLARPAKTEFRVIPRQPSPY